VRNSPIQLFQEIFIVLGKKFEWSLKTRDLFLQIVQLQQGLYRSASRTPSQSPIKQSQESEDEKAKKLEFIRTFIAQQILPLWPENWMQMSILLAMAQSRPSAANTQHQSLNQQQQPQPQKSQMSASLNVTPVASASSNPLARNNTSINEGSTSNTLANGLSIVSKSGK